MLSEIQNEATPVARQIETQQCSRCSGTGHHSYCQQWGSTCFKCGGNGRVYTKKGAAAAAFLKGLRSKRADAFVVGELIFIEAGPMNKACFSKVLESCKDALNAHLWWISTAAMGMGVIPDSMQKMGLTAERKAETLKLALDYQDTLTKAGTVRKQKGGK